MIWSSFVAPTEALARTVAPPPRGVTPLAPPHLIQPHPPWRVQPSASSPRVGCPGAFLFLAKAEGIVWDLCYPERASSNKRWTRETGDLPFAGQARSAPLRRHRRIPVFTLHNESGRATVTGHEATGRGSWRTLRS